MAISNRICPILGRGEVASHQAGLEILFNFPPGARF